MPLTRNQVEGVRVVTGHEARAWRHILGWDEHVVEDYLAMIDQLECRLAPR